MGKLFLLFTVVPLLELYLLLWIGDLLGFWPTVGIVMLTGVVGAALAKREGLRVLRRWQESIANGQMPEEGVLGGLLVLVGGVLLVTPGVLTDVTGLLLLFPPSRRLIAERIRKRVQRGIDEGTVHVYTTGPVAPGGLGGSAPRRPGPRPRPGAVIDVQGEEVSPAPPPRLRPDESA